MSGALRTVSSSPRRRDCAMRGSAALDRDYRPESAQPVSAGRSPHRPAKPGRTFHWEGHSEARIGSGGSAEGEHMTETASGAASQGGSPRDEGLTLRRIYTREGVHPYDEVTWERRDVVMTNWRDGSVNFEQHGVEFPDFWSVNAANIVTTKYFRGALGTPQREWSLKQLVGRVVGTYGAAGREYGYFATEQDAEIFEHELKHALIHQVFSFNSPVWFNVGTTSPQQVAACPPYDAVVSTPAGLVPIGALAKDNAVGMKVYDPPR